MVKTADAKIITSKKGKTCCYINNPDGKGTPILVIHGGPGFGSDPILSEVLGLKSPMYFYDQFGCGGSDKFDNPNDYSLELFIDEIDDVRREFKLTKVILFGMCWGAGLAVAYASREETTGVEALILSSPFLNVAIWERDQMINLSLLPEPERSILGKYEEEGVYVNEYRKALIPYFQHYYFTRGDMPIISRLVFGFQPEVYRIMWGDSELICKGKLKSFDLMDRLPLIKSPVLLVSGDRDTVRVETMKLFYDGFPNAQLAIIPSAGHMIYNEQLEIVKKVIHNFVREVNHYPKKEISPVIHSSQ
jgi:proline-specific peptidases, Bacillus coagulans-type subfamily